jgi:hypothetical protein
MLSATSRLDGGPSGTDGGALVFLFLERTVSLYMLFVVRFSGEPDVRWRALNARTAQEARSQALALSRGDTVEYGAVDPDSGVITVIETLGGILPTGT